ncbi:MAG TPA: hypothetical protein VIL55_11670 [Naasia sp.]|jgi:hypothetical protein
MPTTTSPNYVQQAITRLTDALPDLDPALAQLYALLVLTRGVNTTLEDVHDAWALWRNTTNPAHRSLIPFAGLSHEVQELDRPYMDAIHQVARELGDGWEALQVGDPAPELNSEPCCNAGSPDGYGCTRSRDHRGNHVANTTTTVCAVWPQA